MTQYPGFNATRSEFIEKSGLFSQAHGLPRVAGRLFGMLVFDGEPVSFGDLAIRLQVSRASISTSVRLLEERGLIKRITRPGERQHFLQVATNPYETMLQGIQSRNSTTLAEIARTIDDLPPDAPATGRLREYAQFYGTIGSAVDHALSIYRTNAPNPSASPQDHPKDEEHD